MDSVFISALLSDLEDGRLTKDEVVRELSRLPFEDLGFARIDHHRALRKGFPEVIFAAGKDPEQTAGIFERLAHRSERVLATHVSTETAEAVLKAVPEAAFHA